MYVHTVLRRHCQRKEERKAAERCKELHCTGASLLRLPAPNQLRALSHSNAQVEKLHSVASNPQFTLNASAAIKVSVQVRTRRGEGVFQRLPEA